MERARVDADLPPPRRNAAPSGAPENTRHRDREVTDAELAVERERGDTYAVENQRLLALAQGSRHALHVERERLHGLFMQAPALLCVLRGPSHVYELVNPLYRRVIGGRDVVGKPIREALPELAGSGIYELLDETFASGEPFMGAEVELMLDRAGDGHPEPAWFNFVYQPFRGADARVEGILVHAVDVSVQVQARRRAEALAEDLRRSEELFRVSQEVSPIGFIYFDIVRDDAGEMADLEWRYQNEAASRLNRVASGHDCRGLRLLATFPGIVESTIWEGYRRVAETGGTWQEEAFYGADQFNQWFRLTVVRPTENTLAVSFEDVTRTRELADRQRDEAETNETLLRIGLAMRGLDLHDIVQRVTEEATRACRAQFGAFFYKVIDAKGESYTLYTLAGVPREAFERFPMPRSTAIFAPTFNGEGIVRSADITKDPRFGKNAPYHGMPAGHLPVTSYLAVPVISRSGEVIGGLFFGHEKEGVFTERDERTLSAVAPQAAAAMDSARMFEVAKRERAHAEEANRAKDEFLATVSHELRTPLNAILGWTRMLRGGTLPEEKRARALETIERNARAQVALIEDVLDVSRIITGKVRLDVRHVEMNEIVESAVDTARPAADAKGVRIQLLLDPDAGITMGDANRLQQVVWNLLSNALKFTPKGGRVHVRLQRQDSHVEVVVSDTGQGIPADFLPHVFDRFRQADAAITRKFGGLGLGLSIVKHIVELHGGVVRAESEGTGKGATFTVRIPVVPLRPSAPPPAVSPIASAAPPANGPDHSSDLGGLRVLVVDDEPDARDMLRELLLLRQVKVFVAASSDEALDVIRREPIDVLISDIGMPDEDGYALIRQVRALPHDRGGRMPAVALTAYARSEDRTKALASGFSQHVSKPVEPAELLVVVANLAGRFMRS